MYKYFIYLISFAFFIFNSSSFANVRDLSNQTDSERIVIAGDALTEIVYALNAGDQVVAVDKTSIHPKEVEKRPKIGYWKLLSIEGILSFKPTLFIAWQDIEPANIFNQLTQTKVKTLPLQRIPATPDLLFTNIRSIAETLNKQSQGEELISHIKTDLDNLALKVDSHTAKPKVLFLFNMEGANLVSGKDTIIDELIMLAGGQNVATHQGYKVYSTEAFLAADPDIIVMTTQSKQLLDKQTISKVIPGLELTKAWKQQRIVDIDQANILGLGLTIVNSVQTLYDGFYPNEK